MNAPESHVATAPVNLLHAARNRLATSDAADARYAGATTPHEAWTLMLAGVAKIVDVRTQAEVHYVGRVPGALHVEWHGKDAQQVERFLTALRAQVQETDVLLFLCRSAVRSHHAANVVADAGFDQAFNVLEGFEGQRNHEFQRGMIDGWRKLGLPWIQD